MLDRTLLKRRSLTKLVIEARAGLIPESDDIEDERRAEERAKARVFRLVKMYAEEVAYGSENQAIVDILSYLRHYCDCKGLAFHTLDTAAYALYSEEATSAKGK